jgi:alcohol dehydrogenase class IV
VAGYTSDSGHKVAVGEVNLAPRIIVYDGNVAQYTPLRLWLSSGMRALDHAIEMLYNPCAAETPHKLLSLATCHELFILLSQSKADPENTDIRQRLQIVAFGSLFSISFRGAIGLSHTMGMSSRFVGSLQDILLERHIKFHMA